MEYPRVTWDKEANAGYIYFKQIGDGEAAGQLFVEDKDGDVVGSLDFSSDGELLGIELLDAETQMPRIFRKS